jgi:predicted  nucleic acid-binding Zn-ribbon protein
VNLNLVWRKREKKQIARIEKRLKTEITQLKRKQHAREPHDTVRLRKQISNLTGQLFAANKDLQKARERLNREKEQPTIGNELVENTLVAITEIQQQRKSLESQNKALLDRLQELDGTYDGRR